MYNMPYIFINNLMKNDLKHKLETDQLFISVINSVTLLSIF